MVSTEIWLYSMFVMICIIPRQKIEEKLNKSFFNEKVGGI